MGYESFDSQGNGNGVEVTLDGLPMEMPSERRSINAIRSYLEALALEKQRVLCSFNVEGQLGGAAHFMDNESGFSRIEAETIALDEMPLQILKTAFHQAGHLRQRVASALTLVLINNGEVARELWWALAKELKEPVITLSLLPDTICGPADGRASLTQMRKWQLQQVAAIIKDVDEACADNDTIKLSTALESRVMPWLQNLGELIGLWHETVLAGTRLGIHYED